jgi:hypothetical protein
VTGEKLVFDKTQPATIDRYNRGKLFLAWDGDPLILRSFRLPCWFEPYPHVINSSMQEQETYPKLKATLRVDWIRPTRTEAEELRRFGVEENRVRSPLFGRLRTHRLGGFLRLL